MKNALATLLVIGLVFLAPPGRAQANQSNPAIPAGPATSAAAPAATTIPPDQQATKDQIAKLFEVMKVRQQVQNFQKMMPAIIQRQLHVQMEQTLAKQAAGVQPTPQQEAQLQAVFDEYMQKSFTIYPYDDMISDLTTVYQRHISRSDVDAIIAFYNSPAGQDLLNQQPLIMQEFMPIVMQRERKGAAELSNEMAQEVDALMKTMAPPAKAQAAK